MMQKNYRSTVSVVATFALIFSLVSSLSLAPLGVVSAEAAVAVTPNPSLATSCGLDIALLVDTSSSINTIEMAQMKTSLTSFVNAFAGTPTVFSITRFNTTAIISQNFSLTPSQAATAIGTITTTDVDDYALTNWDDGLAKAFSTFSPDPRPAKPNLLVIATDGNPNKYGNPAQPLQSAFPNDKDPIAALSAAVTRANTIKSAGIRILGIGIGTPPDLNIPNIEQITGPIVAPSAPIDQNVDVVTTDFSTLGTSMAALANGLCGGKILVQTQFDTDSDGDADVTGDIAGDPRLAGDTFTVTGSPSTPAPQTTTDTGSLEFSVLNGTYSVTETATPPGTALATASCTNRNGPVGTFNLETRTISGITMGTDDTIQCTFLNGPPPPARLTVIKQVINDNGGTATAGQWTMDVSATNPSDASFAGSSAGTTITLDPGTYSVSESGAPSGYSTESSEGCSGTIATGEQKTCTITSDDIAPLFTLTKVVTNDNRGKASVEDFSLLANLTALTSAVQKALTAGVAYTITEQGPTSGYRASFSGDCNATGHITLGVGEIKNCTLTNDDITPGTLRVINQVINDNAEGFEGSATPNDFEISVTGGNPSPASFDGSDTGTEVVIDAGASFSVSQTGGPTSAYSIELSGTCSGTMPEGGNLTCTITNNDNPPTTGGLTVIKVVTNDNGGTSKVSDFQLHVTDSLLVTRDITSGESNQFDGGTYTISEITDPNYSATFSGDCDSSGVVTVVNGESKTCTITNNDRAPSLTLSKQVVNDNGGTAVAADWTLIAAGPSTISGEGEVVSDETFTAGTYTLSESEGPSGYASGTWSCSKNGGDAVEGSSVTLAIGDTVVCIITNNDHPSTLRIVNNVINDNGGSSDANDFTVNVTGTNVSSASFPGSESGTDVTLNAGNYSVTVGAIAGYGVTLSTDCSGTIEAGETKTCTITSDDGKATLTLVKNTRGADGTFTFSVTGHANVSITTSEEHTGSTMMALDAGVYSISEAIIPGWTLTSATCSNQNNPSAVTLTSGDSVTCTFTNTATGADVSITKSVDDSTPDVGQTITYTLTATNAGPATAAGFVVHDALPAGLTYVSNDGGVGAYATTTGHWSVPSLLNASTTVLRITATVNSGTEGSAITNIATLLDEGGIDHNPDNDIGTVTITVNTPGQEPPTPPSGGGGGSCASGFTWNRETLKCEPKGQVLGASTPVPQVLGESCGLYMDQHLKKAGPKNNPVQVRKLQEFLNKHGFGTFTPTGYFGNLTLAAVNAFQAKYAVEILKPWNISSPTGLVYLTTIRHINLIECPDLVIPIPTLIPWNQNPNAQ